MRDEEKEPLQLSIDWAKPEEPLTNVFGVTDPGKVELGFSPQFPGAILLYFREGPYALVFEGKAQEKLLTQMLSVLIIYGIVKEGSAETEEAAVPRKKLTLH